MTDFLAAAERGENVRLCNGEVVAPIFNPAGRAGWNIDVLIAYDDYDNSLHWDLNGISFDGPEYDMDHVVSESWGV